MTGTDLIAWLFAALQGITVGAVFVLVVFIAVTVVVGLHKLRHRGRAGARSLEELVGDAEYVGYLPPTAPRGPIDQLGAGMSHGGAP
jgi:hypothetical protein